MYKCLQPFSAPEFCYLHVQTLRNLQFSSYFDQFYFKFNQIWAKSLQNSSIFYFFAIQLNKSARGRLNKRLWADNLPYSPLRADFIAQTTNSPRKWTQKSPQLPQFNVYEDQTSGAHRAKNFGQNESISSLIDRQIDKRWSHITVEIPFQPESHFISVERSLQRGNQQPLASLSSMAFNGAQRAPRIPQDWLKNQLNDHISTFFSVFWLFFDCFLTFLFYFTNICIDPSISNDSTADRTLNNVLFRPEEALKLFKDCKINDLLCSLSNFELISINLHPEKPQNLDINKH